MTPKEQYEYRKDIRRQAREAKRAEGGYRHSTQDEETETMVEIFDRVATAFERIADALEAKAGA